MIYSGSAIKILQLDDQLAQLVIDLPNESVNKFNKALGDEFILALNQLEATPNIRGLLISSAKSVFIVGADIMEFGAAFRLNKDSLVEFLKVNVINFNRIEDLPYPTVVAINGYALGGGFELCLACDFRIMSTAAKVGLPETKLGIMPGWGGSVRLPRMVGLDVAVEWIAGGGEQDASTALKANVVDAVVAPDALANAALTLLKRAAAGQLPYLQKRQQKKSPLQYNPTESLLAFESTKLFVADKAGKHYPAPVAAVKVIQDGAKLDRDGALKLELDQFVKLTQTSVARSLVSLFVSDQWLTKKAKQWEKKADKPVTRAAVLGAGIMGGGIAYQSASRKIPIKMKDIQQKGIDQGLAEASKLATKRLDSGKMTSVEMATLLNSIEPCLTYDGFDQVDLVVEAVVENPKIKKAVLQEVEQKISATTVLCTNTSTISIDELSEGLQRPDLFCGMHFFNPVHLMPLVEVIRGQHTSDAAIAKTVAYANALGKKAIVVNNCPGFLVNRVLFPYFSGFLDLVRDGADIQKIDKVMEHWGWPMGPAYLLDVVGLDTAVHAQKVMAQGFPDRMASTQKTALDALFEAGRLGQKNQQGFYRYETDKKGKLIKVIDPSAQAIWAGVVNPARDVPDSEIITRLMTPMATELARCLEEGIIETPAEADMALIYGLGFPPFKGGIFKWLDEISLTQFITSAKAYEALGPLYQPTAGMLQNAAQNTTYYR